jgi:steroid delta-isomerase-like uncharacterized protein
MSIEQNKALATRFLLEHNQANYMASLDELLAPDVILHEFLPGLPQDMNRAIYNEFIAGFRRALPDIANQLQIIVAEADFVAMRWTGTGTHTGEPLMGIPSSGKKVSANGLYLLRFRDGKIIEVWDNWDNLNLMQQISPVPEATPATA